ncbi:MAG TPA: ABC transporter ATP-binding protein [Bacillota bacterium]|nr:ABC transporter ATP-binding protein [Bacillota bacterium]
MEIRLSGVTKRFAKFEALSRVDLEIKDGELFTLLGPSGCGKTTTLRLIAGFYIPDEGKIFFGGNEVQDIPTSKRNIGMVFQNYALWPHMTVFRNVAYGLQFKGIAKSEWAKHVNEALVKVGLVGYESRYPGQLSGGQQQRVALARALALNPDVLLLDEPLSNLDAKIRGSVRAEIRKLQQALGITTVYVTHDQEEALTLSDRIGIMNEGKLVQVGSPHDLYEKPVTRFVADFIGINNLISGKVKSVDGKWISVETPLGILTGSSLSDCKTGQSCTVAFRPENVSVAEASEQRAFDNLLEGKVSFVSYMGNALRYEVEHAGGLFSKADIKDPLGHKELSWGTHVKLGFPKSAALIIPD